MLLVQEVKISDAYYRDAPSVFVCQGCHTLDFKNSSEIFVFQEESALVPYALEGMNVYP